MRLNTKQRGYLTHMLGAGSHIPEHLRGNRNYYCAEVGGQDEKDLTAMINAGLVQRGSTINDGDSVYFYATEKGMSALGLTAEEKQRAKEK